LEIPPPPGTTADVIWAKNVMKGKVKEGNRENVKEIGKIKG
jgi:hypothetical protein